MGIKMNDETLTNIYARIGEFFANSDTINCILAYNEKESEIMKKCGLSYIGKTLHENEIVEIFMKKHEFKISNPLDSIPQILPYPKTQPHVTPSPHFPPGFREYTLGSGPAEINCKFL